MRAASISVTEVSATAPPAAFRAIMAVRSKAGSSVRKRPSASKRTAKLRPPCSSVATVPARQGDSPETASIAPGSANASRETSQS